VGAIFDGTGYGSDGTVWGGELLVGDLARFERMGMLFPVRLPGGAAAVRQPWRMACAWLAEALGNEAPDSAPPVPRELSGRVTAVAWRQVCELARTGVASPLTTSMGRLFDAVAALCGIRAEVNYEGQAAVELEACCDPVEAGAYPFPVEAGGGPLIMDARPAVAEVARELEEREAIPLVAARFHNALAQATARACVLAAGRGQTETVVLSGGVFQNRRLLERTKALLGSAGLRVLVAQRLPPNDGGIAYGQLAVAAARLAEGAP
jgi:hydrogenase maturation protein HypF